MLEFSALSQPCDPDNHFIIPWLAFGSPDFIIRRVSSSKAVIHRLHRYGRELLAVVTDTFFGSVSLS